MTAMGFWSFQTFSETRDDDGKAMRMTSVLQIEAKDLPTAVKEAKQAAMTGVFKIGAILPGQQVRFP
jgi:hypothetical protein